MRLDVAPEGYSSAAQPLDGAHETATYALADLISALSGCGSMAGSDSGGQSFAAQYDPAATSTARAVSHFAGACASLGNLVKQAAHNHASADARSNRRGGATPAGPPMTPVRPTSVALPSAAGGTGDQPDWWHYVVEHAGGATWPDADTGRLRDAGHAWYLLAESLDSIADQLDSAVTLIRVQDSPEVDQAVAATRHLGHVRSTLAAQCRSLGKSCDGYAQTVDDAHTHTEHIMEACLAGLAVTAVVGIGLTLVTFGGSDAAAAAAAAAEVAAAVEEVIAALDAVIEAAEALLATLEEIAAVGGEAEAELLTFEEAEPELAELGDAEEAEEAAEGEGGDPSELSTSQQRALRSLQRQVDEHEAKLEAYRADPDAYDNQGLLERAPTPEIRQRIIDGRIRHLETEIRAFEDQINTLLGGS